MILTKRSKDSTTRGFDKYEFLTMELWDENPNGEWKFIADSADRVPDITNLEIVVRGTVAINSDNGKIYSRI